MAKNAIVGQSGGPTSVINASLAGVYESCKRRGAGKVYGMLHGVAGLLERRTCVLDDKLKTALDIELLKRTPSSYLGSCRYKLPDWHTAEGEAVYVQLFEILKELLHRRQRLDGYHRQAGRLRRTHRQRHPLYGRAQDDRQ